MRKLLVVLLAVAAACGGSSSSSNNQPQTVATPVIAPAGGTYDAPQSITITCATAGAAIHYTTDGTTPTASSTAYTGAIQVAAATTIKAMATAAGQTDSAVASATYAFQAATPAFSPMPATYATAQSVTITTATPGAAIHYTTDGTTPTATSTLYAGPIPLPAGASATTTTIKAIAVRASFADSAVASATYTIDTAATPTATPVISPASGSYGTAQSVSITCATAGATIHYTLDGVDPTTTSAVYASPIAVSTSTTVKALATAPGHTPSNLATATYTITVSKAALPVFNPPGGTYTSTQSVAITSGTAGAAIYYTSNGATPTSGSTLYSGPISVSTTTTLKAIATAAGFAASDVATATYTFGGTGFGTLCAAVATAFQNLTITCLHANPAIFGGGGPYDTRVPCADYQKAIGNGTILYDPAQGSLCIAEVQALACKDMRPIGGPPTPPSCKAALKGQVANGVACHLDNECAAGYCTAEWTSACPGTCQPFVALNGNCSSGPCDAGLTCDDSTTTPTCKAAGALNGNCPCADGLWCDTSGGAGVCRAPMTSGSCTPFSFDQCAIGFTCFGFPTATCQPLTLAGATCSAGLPECAPGYECSGTCVSWPSVPQACDPSLSLYCIGGYCDHLQMKCAAYKAPGASCASSYECASGSCTGGFCTAVYCAIP